MAGYQGYSKSNNAIQAEKDGLVTASVLAKMLGLKKAATVLNFVEPAEWHHSSKLYNKVNYFDPESVSVELLAQMKAAEGKTVETVIYKRCTVKFTEWAGTGRNAKRVDYNRSGIEVTVKGNWATFDIDGRKFRKSINGKNFTMKKGA